MAAVPTLGYWDIRGNTEPIRLVLHYAGIDFVDKRYTYGPAPDYSRENWLSEKHNLGLPFPNLPYWVEGNLKLVQVSAKVNLDSRTIDGSHWSPVTYQ